MRVCVCVRACVRACVRNVRCVCVCLKCDDQAFGTLCKKCENNEGTDQPGTSTSIATAILFYPCASEHKVCSAIQIGPGVEPSTAAPTVSFGLPPSYSLDSHWCGMLFFSLVGYSVRRGCRSLSCQNGEGLIASCLGSGIAWRAVSRECALANFQTDLLALFADAGPQRV